MATNGGGDSQGDAPGSPRARRRSALQMNLTRILSASPTADGAVQISAVEQDRVPVLLVCRLKPRWRFSTIFRASRERMAGSRSRSPAPAEVDGLWAHARSQSTLIPDAPDPTEI